MSTPAEELRTAAEKLRKLATTVEAIGHPGLPWRAEECSDYDTGNCPCVVVQGRTSHHDEPPGPMFNVADAETAECAAYIAAMGPTVGLALATWLDAVADSVHDEGAAFTTEALAVARAINSSPR